MEKRRAVKENYPDIIDIWSKSVEHTHDFLKQDDFEQIKQVIPKYLDLLDVQLWYRHGEIIGFSALSKDHLEMLFLDPCYQGKGHGTTIIQIMINEGLKTVDVNEQNTGAYSFYKSHGFKQIGRDEKDNEGRDYPILHMKLENR